MTNQFLKTLILLIIACVYGFLSCSEAHKQHEEEIKKEIDSLVTLTYNNLRNIQIDSAEVYIDRALQLCKEVNYSEGCTEAYIFKGQILYYQNQLEQSLKYLLRAEKEPYAKRTNEPMFEIHRIKGQIFNKLNLTHLTVKEFEKALASIPKNANQSYRAHTSCMIYENLVTAYAEIGDTLNELQTLKNYQKIVEEVDESTIYYYKINAYNKIGDYYYNKNDADSARFYFMQAVQIGIQYDYPYFSNSYIYLGNLAFDEQRVDSALTYYYKALAEIETRSIKGDYALIYGKLASVYENTDMRDSAEIYRKKHIQIENELSKEKINVVETTVNAITAERDGLFKSKFDTYVTIGVIVILLAIVFLMLNYIFYRRQIRKKELYVNDLTKKANNAFDEVLQLAKANDSSFLPRFTEVYSDFINALLLKHSNLNKSDLTFCAMKYLGFDTKEIANITFVEIRSVQTKRSRLRKKLDLSGDVDFYQYLHSL